LFLQVGVNHQQQEGCVKELHDEDTVGDQTGLLGKGVVANADDKLDDNNTKHVVNGNNGELSNIVIYQYTFLIIVELIANLRIKFFSNFLLCLLKSIGGLIICLAESLVESVKIRLFFLLLCL